MAFCAPPDLGVPACFFVRLVSLVCLSQRTGLSRAEVQGLACMPPKDVSKSLASNTHTHTEVEFWRLSKKTVVFHMPSSGSRIVAGAEGASQSLWRNLGVQAKPLSRLQTMARRGLSPVAPESH